MKRENKQPELSIVVPTFCEVENVGPLVAAISAVMGTIDWEIIFVDDDSSDGTVDAVRQLSTRNARVRCLRRIGRKGLAGAVIEGMLASSAEVVAVIDCDMQHDEAILPKLLAGIRSGASVAIGTRYQDGGTASGGFSEGRKTASQWAVRASNLFLDVKVSDPMSGFFMLRREVFETIAPKLSTDGFKLLLDILSALPATAHVVEVPYDFRPRNAGESKLSSRVVLDFICQIISKVTFGAVPPRLVLYLFTGGTGVIVHLLTLKIALELLHISFTPAQLIASYVAMTWNFFLNNILTFGDKKLKTFSKLVVGLLTFYLICSVGTLANIGVARIVIENNATWWLAGLAGAAMAAIFNYAVSSQLIWKK